MGRQTRGQVEHECVGRRVWRVGWGRKALFLRRRIETPHLFSTPPLVFTFHARSEIEKSFVSMPLVFSFHFPLVFTLSPLVFSVQSQLGLRLESVS